MSRSGFVGVKVDAHEARGTRKRRVVWDALVRQEENGGATETVVKEGVDAGDDVIEALVDTTPHRVYQDRGHVEDKGTSRCCQHRACIEGD